MKDVLLYRNLYIISSKQCKRELLAERYALQRLQQIWEVPELREIIRRC